MSCIEGKGSKDIHCSAHNATLAICWSIIKYILYQYFLSLFLSLKFSHYRHLQVSLSLSIFCFYYSLSLEINIIQLSFPLSLAIYIILAASFFLFLSLSPFLSLHADLSLYLPLSFPSLHLFFPFFPLYLYSYYLSYSTPILSMLSLPLSLSLYSDFSLSHSLNISSTLFEWYLILEYLW